MWLCAAVLSDSLRSGQHCEPERVALNCLTMNLLLILLIAPRLAAEVPPELKRPNYRISEITGIGHDSMNERQDPGNVIRVGGTYYVW